MDIVADTLMFFKIKVQDKLAPGRLDIKYGAGQYIKRVFKVSDRVKVKA